MDETVTTASETAETTDRQTDTQSETADAVLFDMDGVIVNSEDYWVEFEREEILPAAVPDEDIDVAEVTGMNYREIYDYLDDEYGTAISREEYTDRFTEAAEELYTERVELLEGLHDLLAELDARGIETAIVSSSPHEWIGWVTDRFDLEDSFDEIVSADDIDAASKPEPDVFEYAADEIGVPPEKCVVVEDSANGIEAAHRAETVVIAYRIDAHGDIDYSPADWVADSPTEVREIVLDLVD
ncbi:HAD family hydrolase [Natrialba hulunbeirensis]|nr:HAD family phosphatase [Natrialba hulunbeirensis]